MSDTTGRLWVAKVLLTVAAIQYGVLPVIADLSDSHLFHPDWTPHARFHLVWLLALGAALAAYVVFSVWVLAARQPEVLRHVSLLGLFVLGGFFVAVASQTTFGGALSDLETPPSIIGFDANVFAFTVAIVLQLNGTLLVWLGKPTGD